MLNVCLLKLCFLLKMSCLWPGGHMACLENKGQVTRDTIVLACFKFVLYDFNNRQIVFKNNLFKEIRYSIQLIWLIVLFDNNLQLIFLSICCLANSHSCLEISWFHFLELFITSTCVLTDIFDSVVKWNLNLMLWKSVHMGCIVDHTNNKNIYTSVSLNILEENKALILFYIYWGYTRQGSDLNSACPK